MTNDYIYVVLKGEEIYSSPGCVSLTKAIDSMEAVGADQVLKITRKDLDFITRILNEPIECPLCGDDRVWRNGSGELQCDNCGYSENDEEDITETKYV